MRPTVVVEMPVIEAMLLLVVDFIASFKAYSTRPFEIEYLGLTTEVVAVRVDLQLPQRQRCLSSSRSTGWSVGPLT